MDDDTGVIPDEDGNEESVRVFVRIRPLNKREIAEDDKISSWKFDDQSMIEDTPNGERVYSYDHCFGPMSTNTETYLKVCKPVVQKALTGYNGTVFTYGQTGSGKTWTMLGDENDPGMTILSIRDIIDYVETHTENTYTLKVAYFEVYNEEINDLLGLSKNLKIVSEDSIRGAVIGGLLEETVSTIDDFMDVLRRGEVSRSYASTSMNADSSRSHTLYRVTIECKNTLGSYNDGASDSMYSINSAEHEATTTRISYLNLVDLAGSERQKNTNTTGKNLKEGANINKSLLSLGAVINKLGEAARKVNVKGMKPVFIPYRDSKLTRILKQSLGGNTFTTVLCTATAAYFHREETVSTLKFGQLCKTIKNIVKNNEVMDDKTLIFKYKQLLANLSEQLTVQKKEKQVLEEKLFEEILSKDESCDDADDDAMAELGSDAISNAPTSSRRRGNNAALLKALQDAKAEVAMEKEKNNENQRVIAHIQSELNEYKEYTEAKNRFDEYQNESIQEVEEEKLKVEKEKQILQSDRYKMLNERSYIEEKESRLGSLMTNLDERDSKLRQSLSTLKEQQEQWDRSIRELQRREDVVDDWQRNHHKLDLRQLEGTIELDARIAANNSRETALHELDTKLKQRQRELLEREQKLQVSLSRVADTEQDAANTSEQLNLFEAMLKKREGDCTIKEREYVSRQKEIEGTEATLREKEKKIAIEQANVDDMYDRLKAKEEQLQHLDMSIQSQTKEINECTERIATQTVQYNKLLMDVQERAAHIAVKEQAMNTLCDELEAKEIKYTQWESKLMHMQTRLTNVEEKELHLKKQIEQHKVVEDDFYSVRTAEISAMHVKQIVKLEAVIATQLRMVDDINAELQKLRHEKKVLSTRNNELEAQLQIQANQMRIQSNRIDTAMADMNTSNCTNTNASNNRHSVSDDDDDDAAVDDNGDDGNGSGGDCGEGSDDDDSSNGPIYTPVRHAPRMTPSKDLIQQLADTHKTLEQIIESNKSNASPSYLHSYLLSPMLNVSEDKIKSVVETPVSTLNTAVFSSANVTKSINGSAAEVAPSTQVPSTPHGIGQATPTISPPPPPPPVATASVSPVSVRRMDNQLAKAASGQNRGHTKSDSLLEHGSVPVIRISLDWNKKGNLNN